MSETKIAMRLWSQKPYIIYYVSETPGDDGADWGYTQEVAKAKQLSVYWQRRFLADMRRVGADGAKLI
jgi:hypothetical protein